ncbi:hypothetical protein [Acidithiobacillus thiooxidans]|nr:hypothetical protein [Acidithiobacillus thiooxidans]
MAGCYEVVSHTAHIAFGLEPQRPGWTVVGVEQVQRMVDVL